MSTACILNPWSTLRMQSAAQHARGHMHGMAVYTHTRSPTLNPPHTPAQARPVPEPPGHHNDRRGRRGVRRPLAARGRARARQGRPRRSALHAAGAAAARHGGQERAARGQRAHARGARQARGERRRPGASALHALDATPAGTPLALAAQAIADHVHTSHTAVSNAVGQIAPRPLYAPPPAPQQLRAV